MQAALRDLSLTRHDSQSFVICQRILHQCHEIIFGDLPPPVSIPYATLNVPFQSRFTRRKIRHHTEPVLIGIGVVLAGVPGMPQLTELMGEVAIEQGRIEDAGHELKNFQTPDGLIAHGTSPNQSSLAAEDGDDDMDESEEICREEMSGEKCHFSEPPDWVLRDGGNTPKTSVRRRIGAAQTAPSLPLHLQGTRRIQLSEDPLGQLDSESSVHPTTPYQSSPSISSSKLPPRSATLNLADTLLQRYDIPSQIHLLRSHYCRAEVCDFLPWILIRRLTFIIG
jgi:phosphatidylinositol 4-kinase